MLGTSTTRPFVFLASFPRSGSTILAELLTQAPESLIVSEPGLARGRPNSQPLSALPAQYPVREAVDEMERIRDDTPPGAPYVRAWFRRVAPLLPFEQIGIKEVAFRRWLHRVVLDECADARVVITVRDPRELWLSLEDMASRFENPSWSYAGLGPAQAGERVAGIFRQIEELVETAMVVRYEEINPATIDAVREFTNSQSVSGHPGVYRNQDRPWERDRHGDEAGGTTIRRYVQADPQQRERADQFASYLGDYVARFGY